MGKAIPTQHPAVVLRSSFNLLRALLAVAMVAVVGLTAAVVILATDDERDTSAGSAAQVSTSSPTGSTRYDGGPEEGTRGIGRSTPAAEVHVNPSTGYPTMRYDGGPEEGSRGIGR